MDKPFDNALKLLQKIGPESYAKLLGLKPCKIEYKDTDLSTVSSASDCVLMVDADERTAEHIENQSTYDSTMGERCLVYNVLARKSLGVPVHTTVLLLRQEADGPAMNGILRRSGRNGIQNLEFRFDVVRIWTIPAEQLFECGVGVLPLAFIGDIKEHELPALVRRTGECLKSQIEPDKALDVWTSIKILMGMRYTESLVDTLLIGVKGMEESVTYQAILREGKTEGRAEGKAEGKAEGRAEEARAIVIRLGTQRFGAPNKRTAAAIKSVASLERLEILSDRLLFVSSWHELLKP